MLHRIVYVSAAQALIPPADLARLLDGSRRRNAQVGITGLMLYHDGSFFQVLEGPADSVAALFETIRKDARHRQVITLWSGAASARVFPDWRMGFVEVADLPPAMREAVFSLRQASQDMPDTIGDRTVAVLLNSFLRSFRDLPGQSRFAG
jgi:hypothetical protein